MLKKKMPAMIKPISSPQKAVAGLHLCIGASYLFGAALVLWGHEPVLPSWAKGMTEGEKVRAALTMLAVGGGAGVLGWGLLRQHEWARMSGLIIGVIACVGAFVGGTYWVSEGQRLVVPRIAVLLLYGISLLYALRARSKHYGEKPDVASRVPLDVALKVNWLFLAAMAVVACAMAIASELVPLSADLIYAFLLVSLGLGVWPILRRRAPFTYWLVASGFWTAGGLLGMIAGRILEKGL